MGRTQISIKLDDDLLQRIDRFAAETGETRTAVIERSVRNGLKDQEEYLESLASPVGRAVHSVLTSSPETLRAITKLVREELTEDQIERAIARREVDQAAGKKIQKQRKASKRTRKE